MREDNKQTGTIGSIEKLFTIMEFLKTEDGGRITEIATALDMSKSTVHRYLKTMRQERFVVKDDNEYKLGMRFLDYGGYVQTRNYSYELAGNIAENLANKTNEIVHFVIEEHRHAISVHRKLGQQAVGTDFHVGESEPMYATAAGKAILSEMSDEEVRSLYEDRDLVKFTENTITSMDELLTELQQVRDRGISISDEESIKGIRAIGTPLSNPEAEETIGAIIISGPANRLSDERIEEELESELLSAADEFDLRNTYKQ